MFKFKKNFSVSNDINKNEYNNILPLDDFRKELEEKFPDYSNFSSELIFDECFMFIYKNLKNLKDSLIIGSILRQIEPTIEEVKLAYQIEDQYIDSLIINKIPELRVLANKKLEKFPDYNVIFFPGHYNNFEPIYKEFVERIEYFFEVKRNKKKILSETKLISYIVNLINNSSLLFLLNYLSVKDSLIILTSLNIIDLDEDILQSIYPHNNEYFENIFKNKFFNNSHIRQELIMRIKKLDCIELETSYFDYEDLCNQYKDLEQRIDDTLKFLSNKSKGR